MEIYLEPVEAFRKEICEKIAKLPWVWMVYESTWLEDDDPEGRNPDHWGHHEESLLGVYATQEEAEAVVAEYIPYRYCGGDTCKRADCYDDCISSVRIKLLEGKVVASYLP